MQGTGTPSPNSAPIRQGGGCEAERARLASSAARDRILFANGPTDIGAKTAATCASSNRFANICSGPESTEKGALRANQRAHGTAFREWPGRGSAPIAG